jgi:hypothetical protein
LARSVLPGRSSRPAHPCELWVSSRRSRLHSACPATKVEPPRRPRSCGEACRRKWMLASGLPLQSAPKWRCNVYVGIGIHRTHAFARTVCRAVACLGSDWAECRNKWRVRLLWINHICVQTDAAGMHGLIRIEAHAGTHRGSMSLWKVHATLVNNAPVWAAEASNGSRYASKRVMALHTAVLAQVSILCSRRKCTPCELRWIYHTSCARP